MVIVIHRHIFKCGTHVYIEGEPGPVGHRHVAGIQQWFVLAHLVDDTLTFFRQTAINIRK